MAPEQEQLFALSTQLKDSKDKIATLQKGRSNTKPSANSAKSDKSSITNAQGNTGQLGTSMWDELGGLANKEWRCPL